MNAMSTDLSLKDGTSNEIGCKNPVESLEIKPLTHQSKMAKTVP